MSILPRSKRGEDRIVCFLHLRDLVYLHPKAASVNVIAFVQTLEAAVIAEKASREKRLAEGRERAEGRREATPPRGPHKPHLAGHVRATPRATSKPRGGLQEVDSRTNGCVLGLDPSQ
jgi:hypothetical protein